VLTLAVLITSAALTLAGCSGSDGKSSSSDGGSASASASSASSPSPSSTVSVPSGTQLTDQGSTLAFGDTGTVIFETTQHRGTVLQLTVKSVTQGSLADFKGFILDDKYKQNADYYYARVTVKNVGQGDVGGVAVPLWGVNASNTLLPAVNFTTTFAKCPSSLLPAKFGPGASLSTCLVYLSPDKGALSAISYRPSQEFNPIVWKGDITTPKPTPTKKPTKGKKKG
jgi:hypothetical protein